jgi:phospholipid/cholesterol/gamma-HCH transport system substrate-binding protein
MSRKSNWSHLLQIHEIRVLLAGALLVSSLLVVITLVAGYLHTHKVGQDTFHPTVMFDDGTGLVRGTKVLVRGVEVGTVDEIKLDDQGKVKMVLTIPESYRKMIRTNWVCYPMRDRNLVSDRVLNIDDTAIDPKKRLENLRRFPSLPENEEITFNTAPGRDLESVLQTLASLASQAQGTLNRVNEILDRVSDTTGTLGQMLNSKEAYITAMQAMSETRDVVAESRITIQSLNRTTSTVERATPVFLDSLHLLLTTVSRSARTAERLMGRGDSLFSQSGDMLLKVDDILDRSDRLIDGTSRSWPFRSMLKNSGSRADDIPANPAP